MLVQIALFHSLLWVMPMPFHLHKAEVGFSLPALHVAVVTREVGLLCLSWDLCDIRSPGNNLRSLTIPSRAPSPDN